MQRVWFVLGGEGSVWYNPVLRKHALAPFKSCLCSLPGNSFESCLRPVFYQLSKRPSPLQIGIDKNLLYIGKKECYNRKLDFFLFKGKHCYAERIKND